MMAKRPSERDELVAEIKSTLTDLETGRPGSGGGDEQGKPGKVRADLRRADPERGAVMIGSSLRRLRGVRGFGHPNADDHRCGARQQAMIERAIAELERCDISLPGDRR